MTTTTKKRVGLGLGAAVLAAGLAVGAHAAAQDQNTSPRPPHGRMERGGPAGPPGMMAPGPGGRRRGGPAMQAMLLGRLDLTDAQRAQVRSLVEASRAATRPAIERARTARQALHEAVTAGAVDEAAIRARSRELADAQADLAVARARLHGDILEVLTPEQRTRLEEARTRRAERLQAMRERRQQRMTPTR